LRFHQIKSNQIKSNQIKSNQIKSNQIKSNQIKSNQIINVGEALGSISQPRVSIPEREVDFKPVYEFNSDFCNVSS